MAKKIYGPVIRMENTRFHFKPNFEGREGPTEYQDAHTANIMLTDYSVVEELRENGVYVKEYQGNPQYGDVPIGPNGECYCVKGRLNFNPWDAPNKATLVKRTENGSEVIHLTADTVGLLDGVTPDRVAVELQPFKMDDYRYWTIYINYIKVWGSARQKEAPNFASDDYDPYS